MAAYRTATRLFPGLHAPLLGMGMEYGRMNNLGLAEACFTQVSECRNQHSCNACRVLLGMGTEEGRMN